MEQLTLFETNSKQYMTLKEASIWATRYVNRDITIANISYLLQYGRLKRYSSNGKPLIDLSELKTYYDSFDKEYAWKKKLGNDLNWHLSFVEYKESERTKHVHRLHPYKGKYIPQLVEYFLDDHTDEFKQQSYFKSGDLILDPFCGSGTTMIQCNELGMHSIGVDISAFNTLISNAKVKKYNIPQLKLTINSMIFRLNEFHWTKGITDFDEQLTSELNKYNNKYFPSSEYRRKVNNKEIDELLYGKEKEEEFLGVYNYLIKKHNIELIRDNNGSFLDKWFLVPVRAEIDFMFNELKKIQDKDIKKIVAIIFSRTVRSCRATTHADLGTLKEPITATYYCKKHGKMCKPLFSINNWWQRYTTDTLNRLTQFEKLRTPTHQLCLTGDSRTIDIYEETNLRNPQLAQLVAKEKISGIFSSPPYVGLIDYHEQHAYSYEIFGFERQDELEIGALSRGQNKEAQKGYVNGITASLLNCKKYLKDNYDVFLVANDKFNLYPQIADLSGMKIINQFKRPVLNRVEKDRSNAYSEIIFHLKEK